MREINIQKLRDNLWKELQDTPFGIERRGKVVGTVYFEPKRVASSIKSQKYDIKRVASDEFIGKIGKKDGKTQSSDIYVPREFDSLYLPTIGSFIPNRIRNRGKAFLKPIKKPKR